MARDGAGAVSCPLDVRGWPDRRQRGGIEASQPNSVYQVDARPSHLARRLGRGSSRITREELIPIAVCPSTRHGIPGARRSAVPVMTTTTDDSRGSKPEPSPAAPLPSKPLTVARKSRIHRHSLPGSPLLSNPRWGVRLVGLRQLAALLRYHKRIISNGAASAGTSRFVGPASRRLQTDAELSGCSAVASHAREAGSRTHASPSSSTPSRHARRPVARQAASSFGSTAGSESPSLQD